MTADGVMRIWVEVTVAPPAPVLPSAVSPKEAPAKAPQPPKAAEQVSASFTIVNSIAAIDISVNNRKRCKIWMIKL